MPGTDGTVDILAMDDDFDLLERWRGGDNAAGGRLVERHFSSVFRFFRSKLGADVDDFVQRTFETCVQARDRIEDGTRVRAYLLGIARRVLLRHYRTARKEARIDVFLQVTARELDPSPSQGVAAREEDEVLHLALRQIPLDFQITLELHYWEQLSVQEIASVLGIAPGTVKSRLHRARAVLREQIEAVCTDPGLARRTHENLDGWARRLAASLSRTPGSD
jgi:RNA polymerase sigma factor (sigma-70 family)